jgi:3-phosphoshikimate 1-carboxyvinyltransferase
VLATQSRGRTVIRGAGELRVKESDRLAQMARGLSAMGAKVEELPDGLVIEGPCALTGAAIDAACDHRIAMSFSVAGLAASGTTVISGAEWADISFPGFFGLLGDMSRGAVQVLQ